MLANRSTWAWKAFIGYGLVLALLYLIIPNDARIWIYDLHELAAIAAIGTGIAWRRPAHPRVWRLLGAGIALTALGDLVWTYDVVVRDREPFPSLADAGYLAGSLLVIGALGVLAYERARGFDAGTFLDSATLTLGCGTLAWVFLMAPYAADTSLSLVGRTISVAYPLLDVLMLGVLARLLFGGGPRSRVMDLLVLGVVAALVGDIVYGYLELAGVYADGDAIDLTWIMQFTFFGAAALHPAMGGLTRRMRSVSGGLTNRRLALLAVATLLAPVSLAVQWLRDESMSVPVLAVASALLFLLVLARLNGLVSVHRRAEARERTLRRAGASLGAATTRDEIVAAAQAAASALTEERATSVRASCDGGAFLSLMTRDTGDDVSQSPIRACELSLAEHPELRYWLGEPDVHARAIVAPLTVRDEPHGLIVAAGRSLPAGLARGFEALASQVALALESAALAEDLHRRRSEARFRALVQNAADIIAIVTPESTIRYASPAVERLCGWRPDDLTGTGLVNFVHPHDAFTLVRALSAPNGAKWEGDGFELRLKDTANGWRWCELRLSDRTGDDEIQGIVCTLRDVSERKELEDQLRHQALHDPLTGLPNRALFLDRLAHALARTGRTADTLAVLFIDVDGFKMINDSLRHGAGDELLVTLTHRFNGAIRPGDTVARFGGDEFAVLLEEATLDAAHGIAERLMALAALPTALGGREIAISLSIGIALKTGPETTPDDLLRAADIAMYVAKRQGKARAAVFDEGMTEQVMRRLELETDLRQALAQQEFEVYYQPVVALDSNRIVEVEALVRWHHPLHGMISPADFIPAAEETGLINAIGWWVMETACRQTLSWRATGSNGRGLTLSVNLSPAMFRQADIVERVAAILARTQLPPAALKIEITEGVMMQHGEETVAKLRRLKDLGLRLAIDDFGTGYLSLSYLQSFPLDVIKIDRSFVSTLGETPESLAIVQMIIGLARSLSLEVTGEGIETAEQLAQLQALGSDLGQGYLFARPAPAGVIGTLLAADTLELLALPAD